MSLRRQNLIHRRQCRIARRPAASMTAVSSKPSWTRRSCWRTGMASPQGNAASQAIGQIRGRGLSCFLECVGGLLYESAEIRFADDGNIDLIVATQSSGQGHETSFAELVGAQLGVDPELVRLRQGDSRDVPRGLASIASRSMLMAGSALFLSCEEIIRKARLLAAYQMEVNPADIEFTDGAFRIVGTDRSVALLELAKWLKAATGTPG